MARLPDRAVRVATVALCGQFMLGCIVRHALCCGAQLVGAGGAGQLVAKRMTIASSRHCSRVCCHGWPLRGAAPQAGAAQALAGVLFPGSMRRGQRRQRPWQPPPPRPAHPASPQDAQLLRGGPGRDAPVPHDGAAAGWAAGAGPARHLPAQHLAVLPRLSQVSLFLSTFSLFLPRLSHLDGGPRGATRLQRVLRVRVWRNGGRARRPAAQPVLQQAPPRASS